MIRLSTLLWFGLAAVTGFGLFHLKYEVQALEDDLVRLNRSILAEHEAIHVLKAEWSYVNQPQRLQALANRHLDLKPMRPEQLGSVADVPARGAVDEPAALDPTTRGTRAAPVGKAPGANKNDRSANSEALHIVRQPPKATAPAGRGQPSLATHPYSSEERR
ncbi:MAG TPA: hypothetical protein VJ924_10445 [Alphaproteobacteria bacterium]|nr:hypothetical protein [Alphaproteobacteria bacterium]